jgi:hypothetical protein
MERWKSEEFITIQFIFFFFYQMMLLLWISSLFHVPLLLYVLLIRFSCNLNSLYVTNFQTFNFLTMWLSYLILSYLIILSGHGHRPRPVTCYVTWLMTYLWCQHLCMHLLVLFYSILHYSILFSSHPFYSSSSLTSGMPTLDLRVYKVSPVIEYSLTLTIKLLCPNPSVKPECLCQLLIFHVHNTLLFLPWPLRNPLVLQFLVIFLTLDYLEI